MVSQEKVETSTDMYILRDLIAFFILKYISCQSVDIISQPYFYFGEDDLHISCNNMTGFDQVNSIMISFNTSDILSMTFNRTANSDRLNYLDEAYRGRPGIYVNGSLADQYLNISIDRNHTYCNDSGLYGCVASGISSVGLSTSGAEMNITRIKRPSQMQAISINPSGDIIDDAYMYEINTSIILTCTSNVGSGAFDHRWCLKLENDTEYREVITELNTTHVNTSLWYEGCQFQRRTSLHYQVTEIDSKTRLLCEVKQNHSRQCGSEFLFSETTVNFGNSKDDSTGNNNESSDTDTPGLASENDSKIAAIAGGVCGAIALIMLVIVACKICKKSKGKKYEQSESRNVVSSKSDGQNQKNVKEVIQQSAALNYAFLDLPLPTLDHYNWSINSRVEYAEIGELQKDVRETLSTECFPSNRDIDSFVECSETRNSQDDGKDSSPSTLSCPNNRDLNSHVEYAEIKKVKKEVKGF